MGTWDAAPGAWAHLGSLDHVITSADISHGKILIVDDQAPNVLLLEQMLSGAGYDAISSTQDSSKVCELHLLHRYDLILLDLQMPGMDGFQVMENLKQIETGGYLPVLVITAQPDHKLRALRAGARDFISKPFDLAEVLLRVYNLLEVRLLQQETRRLYDRVVAEQLVSERLLLNALPASIRERLVGPPEQPVQRPAGLITESYAEVTVLFADIVEFTKFSEGASGEVLMGVLKDLARPGDGTGDEPGRERGRTIGEAYLAAVGLSDALADHTIRASHKAVDLIEAVDRFNRHSRFKLKVRIGVDFEPGEPRDRKYPHRLGSVA
jgi:adenylate cyclase